MNRRLWVMVILAAAATLDGCNRAPTPAPSSQSENRIADATADANRQVATAAYDLAVAEAEGNYRVALAECLSLAGQAHTECTLKADSTLAMAKAYARASLAQR